MCYLNYVIHISQSHFLIEDGGAHRQTRRVTFGGSSQPTPGESRPTIKSSSIATVSAQGQTHDQGQVLWVKKRGCHHNTSHKVAWNHKALHQETKPPLGSCVHCYYRYHHHHHPLKLAPPLFSHLMLCIQI